MADTSCELGSRPDTCVRISRVILPPDRDEAYNLAKRLVQDTVPGWGDCVLAFRTTHKVEPIPGGFQVVTPVSSDPYRSAMFVGVYKAPPDNDLVWMPVWVAKAAEA